MKITRDVPGQRLTLEGEAPRIPAGAPALVLVVICLPFVYQTLRALPGAFGPEADPSQGIAGAVLILFWAGLLFSAARSARKAARWPTGLDADRAVGELRIRECGLLGLAKREDVVPLENIRGLTVRRTLAAPSLHDPLRPQRAGPGLALTFEIGLPEAAGAGRARSLTLGVAHLDRPEEVADFALRLGAAAGLPLFRVVRNDARDVEIVLGRQSDIGFASVPQTLGPADYARDTVAPAAQTAVAAEQIPPFDPRAFPSEHRVHVWSPGVEVEFRKPLSFTAIGCLPFTLLALTGPAVFPFIRMTDGSSIIGRLFIAAFLGLFGLVFGILAAFAVASGLPRRARIDWTARTIRFRTLRMDKTVPFEAVKAVELKVVHRVHQGKNPRHSHFAEIGLQVKNSDASTASCEMLLETERFQDDPDTPYKAALPLATELARSLGVERRITEGS